MVYYRNIENDQVLSLEDLESDFNNFKAQEPETYADMTFSDYMNGCLSKNGSLEKLLSAEEVKSFCYKDTALCAWADDLFYYNAVYSSWFDGIFFSADCLPSENVKILGYSIVH